MKQDGPVVFVSIMQGDSALLLNSIISQNSTGGSISNTQFYQDENGGPVVLKNNYSNDFQFNIARSSGNVISLADPFVNRTNGDFSLKSSSPAIGGGTASIRFEGESITGSSKDIYNNNRPNPSGSSPDMGAVENDLGKKVTRFYVSTDGSNNNSGTSDLPFATVEYALNNVASGDTVIMQPGTYQRECQL